MNFFTERSTQKPLKGSGSDNENKPTAAFSQKTCFIISVLFALLLLASSYANAAGKTVPGTPGPISGQINVCAYVGTAAEANYSISPVAGAELYLWTVPSTAQITGGQGTTNISVTFAAGFTAAANKQIKVRAISQDGTSADRIIYLVSQQPSTPGSIVGPSNACIYIGTPNAATYTTARDAAASGYIWGTNAATTMVTHPNGPGADDTIITVVFKNGYKTGPITVQAINNCGFSAARSLTVSGVAPSMPGPISGPTNSCPYMLPNGAVATYSVTPVTGATSYTWITPVNCVVGHPNGGGASDNTITVQYPSDFTGGSISVIASSGCDDSSPRSLSISKLNPGTPGIITPVLKVICPNRQYSYTLPSMPSNTTAIDWTVPVEALSFSGQGGTSIDVFYPETHVNGLVTAKAVNNCASSAIRQSVVNLSRCQLERGVADNSNNTTAGRGVQQNNTQQKQPAGAHAKPAPETMEINVSPNPSKGNFKLQVNTNDKAAINVKLMDLQGREIKRINMTPGQPLLFGNELRPGTYILEVTQGKLTHTEKLLRL